MLLKQDKKASVGWPHPKKLDKNRDCGDHLLTTAGGTSTSNPHHHFVWWEKRRGNAREPRNVSAKETLSVSTRPVLF